MYKNVACVEKSKKKMGKTDVNFLTIFTPTYNRAHTLPRVYESLCSQSCKAFNWLIVDDGSVDDTRKLVETWMRQTKEFEIRYLFQQNGGMHVAHNTAYEAITTELNLCLDSDDRLRADAVERIQSAWEKVRGKGYAGLIALDCDMQTGKIIGKGFPTGLTKTTLGGYYASGGAGDKKLVYRTDVIRSVPPYPVFPGERYVGLVYKYLLIDQNYRLGILDHVICEVEYQPQGSTARMWRQYIENPKGFAFLRKTAMTYPTGWKRLIRDTIHYCASSCMAHNYAYLKETPRKALTVLCTLPGMMEVLYIFWKAGRDS